MLTSVTTEENQQQSSTNTTVKEVINNNDNDGIINAENKTKTATVGFGHRKLKDESEVFKFNAWDDFEWGEEQEKEAQETLKKQSDKQMPFTEKEKYGDEYASNYWNMFYLKNENRFFKDRHWLSREFPEIYDRLPNPEETDKQFVFMEVGCGTGATVFPFLQETRTKNTFVYALDYSKVAIDLVKSHPEYNPDRCKAMVYDLTSPNLPEGILKESVDVISCIFVFSALNPITWDQAVQNLMLMLKPGGMIIFRDYGRYDLAQLRFKGTSKLEDNFYIRGDGTRAYFFTTDEIQQLFENKFWVRQNCYDRNLTVNRSRKLKMYRIWVQAKLEKKGDPENK